MIKKLSLLLCLILANCTANNQAAKKYSHFGVTNKYEGHYKIGAPYTIQDVNYTPEKNDNYSEVGMASWYGGGDGFHGKRTANGDRYDKNALTAAHRTLPLPSVIKVTNLENNRSVILMANDRGPFKKSRILDVSERAAEILRMKNKGSAKVRVEFLPTETKKLLNALNMKEHDRTFAKNSSGSMREAANFIQIGAFRSKEKAGKIGQSLAHLGKVDINKVNVNNQSLYRVRIGVTNKHNKAKVLAFLNKHDLRSSKS